MPGRPAARNISIQNARFIINIGTLPQTNLDGGMAVAERLRSEVESLIADGLKVTISIGVSAYPETGIESVDELIHEADEALDQSKAHGRNRVTRADAIA